MNVIEETDFYDFFMLINKIRKRNEDDAYAEIRKIQMLTQVIHTSEPQKLVEELESAISSNDGSSKATQNEIGDLEGLKSFGQKVGDN